MTPDFAQIATELAAASVAHLRTLEGVAEFELSRISK